MKTLGGLTVKLFCFISFLAATLRYAAKVVSRYASTTSSNTTHSTWLERTELMSFEVARSRKHIHGVFCTIGRQEHIH